MKLKNKTLAILAGSLVVGFVTGSDININVNETDLVNADSASKNQVTQQAFTDVTGNTPVANAINWMYAEGYLEQGDGTFKPAQPLTVQSLAYMYHNTGLLGDAQVKVDLKDNPNVYAGYVQLMIDKGLYPNIDVTDEALMKSVATQELLGQVIVKSFNLTGATLQEALEVNNIVEHGYYNPYEEVTRASFAVQLHHAITQNSELNEVKESLDISKIGVTVENKRASASMLKREPEDKISNFKGVQASVNPVVASTVKVKNPFKDVSPNNANYYIIHEMRDMGIINGYADGTFKPSNEISRQNVVAMITRYTPVKYEGTKKVPTLTDVTTKNANYKGLVEFQKLGVFNVASNGKVFPTKAVTRGEMAKALVIAFDLPIDSKATSKLKDVPKSLKPYVAALEKAKITTGYEDNTFRPSKTLSRSNFAAFMHRAIKYTEAQETDVEKPVTPPTEETKPTTPIGTPPPIDLTPTNPSVLNQYSASWDDVYKTEPPVPNINGMSRQDLAFYQGTVYGAYGEAKNLGVSLDLYLSDFENKKLISDLLDIIQISEEEFYRALNYTQRTGEVYKSEYCAIYFKNTRTHDGRQYFTIAYPSVWAG